MKKVLLGTIFAEPYLPFFPHFIDYVNKEKELYPELEVLIVTDNTPAEMVASLREEATESGGFVTVHDLGHVPNPYPGQPNFEAIVQARNYIMEYATNNGAEVLYFLDVDTIPKPGALGSLIGYLNMPGVMSVAGCYHYKVGLLPTKEGNFKVSVGDFPATDPILKQQLEAHGWTDRARAFGFGFTLLSREVFSNPEFRVKRDFGYYVENAVRGSEDFPVYDRIRQAGYRIIWVRDVRAMHLSLNKELNRVEAI